MIFEDRTISEINVQDRKIRRRRMKSLQSRYDSFVDEISDQPYYRIFASPTESNSGFISTGDQQIQSSLFEFPNKRFAGFGTIETTDISIGRWYKRTKSYRWSNHITKRWIF